MKIRRPKSGENYLWRLCLWHGIIGALPLTNVDLLEFLRSCSCALLQQLCLECTL
jgi:hypothetical protein